MRLLSQTASSLKAIIILSLFMCFLIEIHLVMCHIELPLRIDVKESSWILLRGKIPIADLANN